MKKPLFLIILLSLCNILGVKADIVAKIGVDGYATLAEAVEAATSDATISLASNVELTDQLVLNKTLTLDLNGYTISSSITSPVKVYKSTAVVTIKDSSAGQTGKIVASSTDAAMTTLALTSGTVEFLSGTIEANCPGFAAKGVTVASGKVFNFHGGKIVATGAGVHGAYITGTFNALGGEIEVNASATGYGVYAYASVSSTTGAETAGVVNVDGDVKITVSGSTANGVYASASRKEVEGVYHEAIGTVNVKGGEIIVSAVKTANGSNAVGRVNIQGGTFNVEGPTPVGIASTNGETVMTAGTINVTSNGTTAYGAKPASGTVTLNGGNINVIANTSAYGVYAPATTSSTTGNESFGTVVVNDINLTVDGVTAYGAYSVAYAKNVLGIDHKLYGKLTLNGGTFDVNGSTKAYGVYAPSVTLNGERHNAEVTVGGGTYNAVAPTAYGAYASGKLNVAGGQVNAIATATAAYGTYAVNGTVIVSGGQVKATSTAGTINGAYTSSNAVTIINGGNVVAEGTSAYGAYVKGGKLLVSGAGDVYATGEKAYGVYAYSGTAEIDGGKVRVNSEGTSSGYAVYVSTAGTANLTGGEISGTGYKFYGVYTSKGNALVDGATIKTEAANVLNYAYGVYNLGGNTTVESGTIDINSSSYAYGVYAGASATDAPLIVNGGDITASGSSSYAAYAAATVSSTTMAATKGSLEIHGGTFTAKSPTSTKKAYALYISGAQVDATTASPSVYVDGGNFAAIGGKNETYNFTTFFKVDFEDVSSANTTIAGGCYNLRPQDRGLQAGSMIIDNDDPIYIYKVLGIEKEIGYTIIDEEQIDIAKVSGNDKWVFVQTGKTVGKELTNGLFVETPALYTATGYVVDINTDEATKDLYPYTIAETRADYVAYLRQLLEDASVTDVPIEDDVTFESSEAVIKILGTGKVITMNEHTINVAKAGLFEIGTGVDVTITGNGTIAATAADPIYVKGGSLVIENGTYMTSDVATGNVLNILTGDVNILGGTFNGCFYAITNNGGNLVIDDADVTGYLGGVVTLSRLTQKVGQRPGINSIGYTTINNGSFKTAATSADYTMHSTEYRGAAYSGAWGRLTINGGKFVDNCGTDGFAVRVGDGVQTFLYGSTTIGGKKEYVYTTCYGVAFLNGGSFSSKASIAEPVTSRNVSGKWVSIQSFLFPSDVENNDERWVTALNGTRIAPLPRFKHYSSSVVVPGGFDVENFDFVFENNVLYCNEGVVIDAATLNALLVDEVDDVLLGIDFSLADYVTVSINDMKSMITSTGTSASNNLLIYLPQSSAVLADGHNNVIVYDGSDYLCKNLILEDKQRFVEHAQSFVAENVSYTRTMSASNIWGTIILPFELYSDDDNVSFFGLKSISTDKFTVYRYGSVAANTPLFFKKMDESATSITISGTDVLIEPGVPQSNQFLDEDRDELWDFYGTYEREQYKTSDLEGIHYYYMTNNRIMHADSGITGLPFRAFLQGPSPDTYDAARGYAMWIYGDDVTSVESPATVSMVGNDKVFDLSGRSVKKASKGIYIVNGKKVLF